MASKGKKPVAKAMPVAKAVPIKATNQATRLLNRIKKGSVWMTTNNWLMVSKLITVVGLLIFAISTAFFY